MSANNPSNPSGASKPVGRPSLIIGLGGTGQYAIQKFLNEIGKINQNEGINRDIKPSNLLVIDTDERSISDWLQESIESSPKKRRENYQKPKARMTIQTALQEYPLLVVLGDPGSGKTTLLKYITLCYAENKLDQLGAQRRRLPIFVRLYDYISRRSQQQNNYSLVDYLYTQAHDKYILNLPPGFFEDALTKGECCLCLDGLDELGSLDLRHEMVESIQALATRFPRNQFIITSRIVGYSEAPLNSKIFTHLTVLPFSDEDIQNFVRKWYWAREPDHAQAEESAQSLIKTILEEPRIKLLATNPLMLTIIALVHRIEAQLPNERVKLYEKCVTTLVDTWYQAKGIKYQDQQRPAYIFRYRFLEWLAYWMHSQVTSSRQAYEIQEHELEDLLAGFLLAETTLNIGKEKARQEVRHFVETVKSRTGLLIERGEKLYSFTHLTFQEYMAAGEIVKRFDEYFEKEKCWAELEPHLHEAHWREVILLVLGRLNTRTTLTTFLVTKILDYPEPEEKLRYANLLLAARILADHIAVDFALKERIWHELVLLMRISPAIADQIITLLMQFKGEDEIKTIISLLVKSLQDNSISSSIHYQILFAFYQNNITDPRLKPVLQSIISEPSREPALRAVAAYIWGVKYDLTVAQQELTAIIKDQTLPMDVCGIGLEFLAQLGNPSRLVIVELEKILRNPVYSSRIRCAIAVALIQLGQLSTGLKALQKLAITRAQPTPVRELAIKAMGAYGKNDVETGRSLLLMAGNKQTELDLRIACCEALATNNQTEAVVLVLDGITKKQGIKPAQIMRLVSIFESLKDTQRTIKYVSELMEDKKLPIETRCWAVQVLVRLNETDRAVIILKALEKKVFLRAQEKIAIAKAYISMSYFDQAYSILYSVANNSSAKDKERLDAVELLTRIGRDEGMETVRAEIFTRYNHLRSGDNAETLTIGQETE